jgi:hypothetical protein
MDEKSKQTLSMFNMNTEEIGKNKESCEKLAEISNKLTKQL